MNTKDIKHTKGPWEIVFNGHAEAARPAIIQAEHLVIHVDHGENFGDPYPDAALISVAPDMYALLRAWRLSDPSSTYTDKIDAVIARIEGK